MNLTQEVIEKLKSLKTPYIIAVSGFGGSGKTSYADLLAKELNAPVISIDSFTQGEENVKDYSLWELVDFKRFEKEVLIPFTEGENPIYYSKFDWENNVIMNPEQVNHKGILIVEGVGLLRSELMKYFAFTVWIDCPINEAARRGKNRDREVWHNPKDELWEGIWKKNDLEYFERFKPKENVNLVVDNSLSD